MSRCRPSRGSQKETLQQTFDTIEAKLEKRLSGKKLTLKVDWDKLEKIAARAGGDPAKQVWEEDVEKWRERLRKFITSPIDKYPGEMAIL